jgi:hypothetical protein
LVIIALLKGLLLVSGRGLGLTRVSWFLPEQVVIKERAWSFPVSCFFSPYLICLLGMFSYKLPSCDTLHYLGGSQWTLARCLCHAGLSSHQNRESNEFFSLYATQYLTFCYNSTKQTKISFFRCFICECFYIVKTL